MAHSVYTARPCHYFPGKVPALVADRWTAIVIYAPVRGTMHFGRLQREIKLSQKALIDTLRLRQRDELVHRLMNNPREFDSRTSTVCGWWR